MDRTREIVNFLNERFVITRKMNMPIKDGRSLGANVCHSVDGMILREITRRCSYDPNWITLVRELLAGEVKSRFTTEDESQDAHHMVECLWRHYDESGYLSARILDYLDSDTLQWVDAKILRKLVDSRPEKPFSILTIHHCFRCLPNYANDLRTRYNLLLHFIARSNLLSYLLSQLHKRTVQIGKLDQTMANDILTADYALS